MIRDVQAAWAVLIGGNKFALDGHGVKWITGKRKDAIVFAKELRNHISDSCKVVRVTVQIELSK